MLGLSGRRRNASLKPLVAADHKSKIPLGEIWQSKGAKLCDEFHSTLSVRDSDWLRMMYLRGDCVSVWLLIFFFLSLIPLLPAIAVMWIPTIVSIENVSGRLTMVLILIPIIIGPLFVFCFLRLNGGLDWYLLMKGETLKIKTGNEEKIRNDSPQLDWIIECFEAKIDHAKRLIEVDHEPLNNRHTCEMVTLRMSHMSIPQRVHHGSA